MRSIIITFFGAFICLVLGLTGCSKSDLALYNSPASVYFELSAAQRDSILYTFAYTPEKAADTLFLPVKLEGIRTGVDRNFVLKIDKDSSTAVEGKHYAPLAPSYTIPANEGICYVPIILYNTDEALQTRSVSIKFYLEGTTDLGISMPKLCQAKLVFSSKLERPDWWSMWMGDYYSQVKHQLFIIVTGQTTLTTGTEGGLDAPKNLYFVSLLTSFLNNPEAWVEAHPDKGYVLEQINDTTYHFYNKDNPDKVIIYQLDSQTGGYYFMDENNEQVH